MMRSREVEAGNVFSYGAAYPFLVAADLFREDPTRHEIINRGVSGNRVVDIYARIKCDVWNFEPDVLSILIGINDIWHETAGNGVEIDRFEKVYRMLLEDTFKRLPNVKIILCEPFALKGEATEENWELFKKVYDYAAVVKKLAGEYGAYFLPLQAAFDEKAAKFGAAPYLFDGVHPNVAGAALIADEWLKLFKEKIEK